MTTLPATFVPGFHDEDVVSKMQYCDFGSTGLKLSKLGLGTAGFSTLFGNYTFEECNETVQKALKSGINYIDTAPYYGHGTSETTLGKCLQGIPRQAYYVATKVGRYEKDPAHMFDFSAAKTRASINLSLKKLGVDYIDVLQIHDIEFAPSIDYVIKETLPVVLEAVKEGKAKYIGVTGYPVSALKEFIEKSPVKLDMVLSYARLTLIDSSLKDFLPSFEGLGVINAAGIAMGLLCNNGPQPWHPAHQDIKDACEEARDYCKSKNVELARLAMHHIYEESKGPQAPHIHLVGMNKCSILDVNLDAVLNGLSPKELEILDYLKKNVFTKVEHHHWEGCEKY